MQAAVTTDLKPMDFGEILDGAFTIYRRHFGLFMRLSALLVWFPLAITIYAQLRFGNPVEMVAIVQQRPAVALLGGFVILIGWITATLLLTAGTIRIISDSHLTQRPSLGAALRLGIGRIFPLLVVGISKGLLTFVLCFIGAFGAVVVTTIAGLLNPVLGVLAGIIGFGLAFWFVAFVLSGYGITTPIVVLEDLGSSFDSFGRSWALTAGAKRKVFGAAAVTWLLAQMLPQFALSGVAMIAGAESSVQPFVVVLSALLAIALAPLLPCALTLVYYDLRVRREAFDLQILSQQLGAAS